MESVLNSRYPLSRQLFWYTVGEPAGLAGTLLDWVLSPEGQELVSVVGYFPLRPLAADR